jgi:predicted DCC family thiol-disulfide oxidoreductase YuxK
MRMSQEETPEHLVFYDGDCGFCNSSVQFILEKRKLDFYFIPLQAEKSQKWLGERKVTIALDTIYYIRKGKLYDRSSAALQIARGLKGAYRLLFVFYFVPKFLRDPFYALIAKYRHKLRAGYCVLPKPEDQQFFIQ